MDVSRDGNRVIVSEPLGFDFDDGRLVLSIRQAKELEEALNSNRAWIFEPIEEEHEDG